MYLYDKLLNNKMYLDTEREIDNIKFITDGKWDWEHGLGHSKRVAEYVKDILLQLKADERIIDLGMTAALLHDIGLSKGDKVDHALESSKIFINYIDKNDITCEEEQVLRQAILDHPKGVNIKSLIGLSLVLADKLDVTYHRTINSSIQDEMNKEIQKIKNVKVCISEYELVIQYITDNDFNINVLDNWPKAITVPYRISKYLKCNYKFMINNSQVDVSRFINSLL